MTEGIEVVVFGCGLIASWMSSSGAANAAAAIPFLTRPRMRASGSVAVRVAALPGTRGFQECADPVTAIGGRQGPTSALCVRLFRGGERCFDVGLAVTRLLDDPGEVGAIEEEEWAGSRILRFAAARQHAGANSNQDAPEGDSHSVTAYHGSPMRRRSASKRGSDRSLSHVGSTLRYARRFERSSYALSSQANAWSLSPNPVYTMANDCAGT